MAYIHRTGEKRKSVEELEYEDGSDELHMSPQSPNRGGHPMESEKRLRREIANSNERRRMQSINAGFESLKALIPHHREEKLSKAAILQQTSEHIANLDSDKNRLLSQNTLFRQKLQELNCNPDALLGSSEAISGSQGSTAGSGSQPAPPLTVPPAAKRRKRDTESSDEGISLGYDDSAQQVDELRKEVVELRLQLERERKLRQAAETRVPVAPSVVTVEAPLVAPVVPALVPAPQPQTPAVVKPELPPTPVVRPYKPVIATDPVAAQTTKFEVISAHGGTATTMIPPPQPRHVPVFNSSMSKRNLDTIVEAIRHLEGDNVYSDLRRGARVNSDRRAEDAGSLSSSLSSSSSSAVSSDDAADSPPPPAVSSLPLPQWPVALPHPQKL